MYGNSDNGVTIVCAALRLWTLHWYQQLWVTLCQYSHDWVSLYRVKPACHGRHSDYSLQWLLKQAKLFLHDPTTVHLRTVCKFTEAHVLCYTLPSQIPGSQESLVYCSPCPLGPAQFSLGSLGHGIPGTVSYRLPGAVTPWKPAMAGGLFKR